MERSPAELHPLRRVILHHTATKNDDPDPALTVQSIYRYHTTVRGWGDVGYHYLIDGEGRIYEGRYTRRDQDSGGGKRAGSAATELLVTGRHTRGANEGSIGIALLGSYGTRRVSEAARAALVELIVWVCDRYRFDPRAQSSDGDSISAHRDWVPDTECPGDGFYAELAAIRRDVLTLLETAS